MPSLEANTTQVGAHTDNRHIISMKSRGFLQTPQDIMEKYNGCSVPQYTAYRFICFKSREERIHSHCELNYSNLGRKPK